MAAELVDWLMRATLATSAAIVLVLALRPLWRRALGTSSVLWPWLLVPALLVAVSVPRPARVVAAPEAPAAVVAADPGARPADAIAAPHRSPPASPAIPLRDRTADALASSRELAGALVPAWLAGALALAALLAWHQHRFQRRLGTLRRRGDGSFAASAIGFGPVLIGALRPRIVVPADFEQRFDAEQRALVLAHERVHLRRGDLQVNLLAAAMRCVFWFNPLVHVAAARLRIDQELACDAAVLRRHPSAGRAYATALLNSQLAVPGLPVGCQWQSSHPLKWRIAMLKQPLPGAFRLVLGAGLAVLASSATAVTLWQAQPQPVVFAPMLAASGVAPAAHPAPVAAVAPSAKPAAAPSAAAVARVSPAPSVHPAPAAKAAAASPSAAVPAPATAAVAATPAVPATAATPAAVPAVPASPASPDVPAAGTPAPEAPDAADAPAVPAGRAAPAEGTPDVAAVLKPPRVFRVHLADVPRWSRDREFDREKDAHVVVQVDVDATGKPRNPRVLASDLGRAYQDSALRAVRHWRFEPAQRDGVAVASTVAVPVVFDVRQERLDELARDAFRHPRPMGQSLATLPAYAGAAPMPKPTPR